MAEPFGWTTYDVRSLLPASWQADMLALADSARHRVLKPRSVTSREPKSDAKLATLIVDGAELRSSLPWLTQLYCGRFLELAQACVLEHLHPADHERFGVMLQFQRGNSMRYECHVDSNPLQGLLYVTTHPPGSGGELVVSNRGDVGSPSEVDEDCSTVYPVSGHLIFFDGRSRSHYVRPLVASDGIRAVAAMTYYTASQPESSRPSDLIDHVLGEASPD